MMGDKSRLLSDQSHPRNWLRFSGSIRSLLSIFNWQLYASLLLRIYFIPATAPVAMFTGSMPFFIANRIVPNILSSGPSFLNGSLAALSTVSLSHGFTILSSKSSAYSWKPVLVNSSSSRCECFLISAAPDSSIKALRAISFYYFSPMCIRLHRGFF